MSLSKCQNVEMSRAPTLYECQNVVLIKMSPDRGAVWRKSQNAIGAAGNWEILKDAVTFRSPESGFR